MLRPELTIINRETFKRAGAGQDGDFQDYFTIKCRTFEYENAINFNTNDFTEYTAESDDDILTSSGPLLTFNDPITYQDFSEVAGKTVEFVISGPIKDLVRVYYDEDPDPAYAQINTAKIYFQFEGGSDPVPIIPQLTNIDGQDEIESAPDVSGQTNYHIGITPNEASEALL